MAITYPTDWLEACFDAANQTLPPDASDLKLGAALGLLQATHPGRYEHLAKANLLSRMNRERPIPSGTPNDKVRGLRVFVYKYNAGTTKAQIAAFYFVRLKNPRIDQAYCMTVGVDPVAVNGDAVYTQLKAICQFMQFYNPKLQLEIVNSERELKHLRTDSDGGKVLVDAYNKDVAAASPVVVFLGEYDSSNGDPAQEDPWFPNIKRWLIKAI